MPYTTRTQWDEGTLECEAKIDDLTFSVVIYFYGRVMPGGALLYVARFLLELKEDVGSLMFHPITVRAISATNDEWRQLGEAIYQCPKLVNVHIDVEIPRVLLFLTSYRGENKCPVYIKRRWLRAKLHKNDGNCVLVLVWMVGLRIYHKSTFPLPIELIRALHCYIL